ncbi:MAG: AtpZ/AtpI family protein [Alphaproteobacteria bacterium]
MATHPTDQREDPDQDRLDELGRKIEAARGAPPEQGSQRPAAGRNVAYRLPTEFVAAVFVGAALGWGFDALTGLRPVGIFVFSILGIAAAFYSVFRVMRELNAKQKQEGK